MRRTTPLSVGILMGLSGGATLAGEALGARALRPLLGSTALAQTSTPPAASAARRGGLAVVGLRTPDGDVDVAGALSSALRDAARAQGYEVPDNTPSFDQEFAMVGCATTSPECLSLIAGDLHAQKYLYGTLLRVGRGRDAPMSVEVSLWDDVTRREVHREAATLTRAQMAASPDTVRDIARRMMEALTTRDTAAQQDRLRQQQAEDALRAREAAGGLEVCAAAAVGRTRAHANTAGASQRMARLLQEPTANHQRAAQRRAVTRGGGDGTPRRTGRRTGARPAAPPTGASPRRATSSRALVPGAR